MHQGQKYRFLALPGVILRRRLANADPRYWQIGALMSLLIYNINFIDFGARTLPSALAITSALATQIVCTRLAALPRLDLRSPLITGLSLSLLLRADAALLYAIAGALAIGSKFVVRWRGKHIFNPAGFAIVVLLLTVPDVWISPGQWGTSVWLVSLIAFAGILVVHAANRADIVFYFLASHAALLFARASWLGDPLAIPLHQLQSGSLLIFAFFMISDPKTAPDSRAGRLVFAAAVAALAHGLAFAMQMRPALYVALIALSPLVPLLDRGLPAARFAWPKSTSQGASR
jgi:enediyne biosynthesis protein E5